MADSDKEAQSLAEPQRPSDAVLNRLGLTEQDYEAYKGDEQAEAQRKAELFQKGREYYRQAHNMYWNGFGGVAEIDLGYIKIEPQKEDQRGIKPEDIADVTLSMLPKVKESNPQIANRIDNDVVAFLGGYVEGALEKPGGGLMSVTWSRYQIQSWQTAINTIDAITEGGIMTNQIFLDRIVEMTGRAEPSDEQKTLRSQVSELVQKRINQKPQNQLLAQTSVHQVAEPKGPNLN